MTHRPTGLFYIGSTGNLYERRHSHLSSLKGGYHTSVVFQRAFTNVDDYDFVFELFDHRERAYEREEELIDLFAFDLKCVNKETDVKGRFFSTLSGGDIIKYQALAVAANLARSYPKGAKRTEETKLKMSEAAKRRDPLTYRRGFSISDGHKEAISKAQRERPRDKGYKRTERTIELLRESGKELSLRYSKRICIEGIEYKNSGQAASAFGLSRRTVINRLVSNSPRWVGWKYL